MWDSQYIINNNNAVGAKHTVLTVSHAMLLQQDTANSSKRRAWMKQVLAQRKRVKTNPYLWIKQLVVFSDPDKSYIMMRVVVSLHS